MSPPWLSASPVPTRNGSSTCSPAPRPVQTPEVEIVSGDPAQFVRGLKQQDVMGIWLCGGGKREAGRAAAR